MKTKIIFIFLFVSLFSCGAAVKKNIESPQEGRPSWVDNPTEKYPDSRFLTAIGLGDIRTAAEDNARGNIAKIFQSDIKLDQTLVEDFKENEKEFSKSMNMLTQTNIKSNQSLKNIKIGESWFNSNEGRYYVLAYLNRQETAMIYTEEMDQNSLTAQEAYKQAQGTEMAFSRYAFLKKGQDALQINKYLEAQLRIISPHNAYAEDTELQKKISDDLRKTKSEVTCAVITNGNLKESISASLRELVAKFGFPVVESVDDAKLVFTANTKTETTKLEAPGTFYLYDLSIDMQDKINGKTVETFTAKGREGHLNESSALKRVSMALDKKISKDYYKKINKYIKSFAQ